jgi:hypothetical protein
MRHKHSLLLSLLLFAGSLAQSQQHAASAPMITGVLEGSRAEVFVTPDQSCSANDVPDAMARAFRDYKGIVHFVTASSELFESLGPSLENLQRSCEVAHRSAGDPNPADFNDQTWIDSFYTLDGKTIAGLTHTEYHGWAHPGECSYYDVNGPCEYDSDTFHLSTDGGYHFDSFQAPRNFLAGVPYRYVVDHGPTGYSVDTNVIRWNGWYYAVATDWAWPPGCGDQPPHRCRVPNGGAPLRTRDVFDPTSWRSWNGSDFSLSFADPYVGTVEHPEEHIYRPVPYMTFVNAINIYGPANIVVATLWNGFTNEYGKKGLYLTTSTDLVNWTTPTLVVALDQLLAKEPAGNWSYAYFSLLDPLAPDMNFSAIGDHPYLYYVRLNNNDSTYRVLFRQPISLTLNQ